MSTSNTSIEIKLLKVHINPSKFIILYLSTILETHYIAKIKQARFQHYS